jgi:hypothetical protein
MWEKGKWEEGQLLQQQQQQRQVSVEATASGEWRALAVRRWAGGGGEPGVVQFTSSSAACGKRSGLRSGLQRVSAA